jgi:hypothetical protein
VTEIEGTQGLEQRGHRVWNRGDTGFGIEGTRGLKLNSALFIIVIIIFFIITTQY